MGQFTSIREIFEKKKGQVWYLDFMVAILIFTIIIILYFQYYGNYADSLEQDWQDIVVESKSVSTLLMSPGYPVNWTNDTIEVLGITDGNYRINMTKLQYLKNMTDEQARTRMNTRFFYYIFLEDSNGTIIETAGSNSTDSKFLVQTTRFVIYNSSVHKLGLYLWGN